MAFEINNCSGSYSDSPSIEILVPQSSRFQRLRAVVDDEYWKDVEYQDHEDDSEWTAFPLLVFTAVLLAGIGSLTKFNKGSSTSIQRGFSLAWIIVGGMMGGVWPGISESVVALVSSWVSWKPWKGTDLLFMRAVFFMFLVVGGLFVPAIGGMVVVGKMFVDFGVCSRI
jgi:hypothetical protein